MLKTLQEKMMNPLITQFLNEGGYEKTLQYETLPSGHQQQVVKIVFAHEAPIIAKSFFGKQHIAKANAEYISLQSIHRAVSGFAPKVISKLSAGNSSAVLMEFVEESQRTTAIKVKFAEKLAGLHQTTQAAFGFETVTFIAGIQQNNHLQESWTMFYIEQRLQSMFKKAFDRGFFTQKDIIAFEALQRQIETEMPAVTPSLIHGDLWNGNVLFTKEGGALIDACIYYGHSEMDLAMMQLFGGFDSLVFETYHEFIPKVPGMESRRKWYQLYYLLLHVVLFGGSYVSSCRSCFR